MAVVVAAVADDDTGATDLAGMLTSQGMHVCLLLDAVSREQLRDWTAECDAVVLGTASRSIPPDDAYDRTAAAVRLLQELQPQRLAIKYCSTFDSTAQGNIGPSIEAAMDVTGERFTIALPALPALGRTTYMGYHFVDEQMLSDSSLRNHPLNPMTNSHLPSHLQSQMRRRVGLVSWQASRHSAEALRAALSRLESAGVAVALLDCLDDDHLHCIGHAIAETPLLTGSSAWGTVLPALWKHRGLWQPSEGMSLQRDKGGSGFLIISGSCSETTAQQNLWAERQGFTVLPLRALDLVSENHLAREAVERAAAVLAGGGTCLLTTAQAQSREDVHRWAATEGLTGVAAGERIAARLARIANDIVSRTPPQGLVVAGGETSSTVMRTLGLGGLRVGANIEPGVPVCVALAKPQMAVVLKSGNFGSPDFYGRALAAMRAIPTSPVKQKEDA